MKHYTELITGFSGVFLACAFGSPATAAGDEPDTSDRANYAQFWEKKIKPAQGEVFRHSSHQPKVSLAPRYAKKVQEVMQSEAGKAVRAGKLKLDKTKKLALQNSATHAYASASLKDDVLREFSERASAGFEQFFDYIGRPDLMPELEFRLLEEDTEFEAPTPESGVMYLAWRRKIQVSSKMYYQSTRKVILSKTLTLDDSVRGQLVGVFTGKFDGKKGVDLKNKMHHAYGGVGYSAITTYAVPMSELFPVVLRELCASRVNDEVNAAWAAKGKPVPLKMQDYQPIITKWDVREDSLVESLIDEFIGIKLDELGFAKEEWVDYCKHGNSPQYALAPGIKEKIKKLGAPEVLRLYLEEPEKLF